ncbi:hypothetical protein [Arthrobacter sp. H5]|uniref:hypothetical protein n=1 Tax=Arthrobacter sp. H5 TaxID=1267973 RepID=UPI0012DD1F2D|nr:hypothetical protein [Arthrobacter sp. H5]
MISLSTGTTTARSWFHALPWHSGALRRVFIMHPAAADVRTTDSSVLAAIELATSAAVLLGLVLFFSACVLLMVNGTWVKTRAVVYTHEGRTGLRWHNTYYEIEEVLLAEDATLPEPPGAEVVIYYRPRRPADFSLRGPYRNTRRLAISGVVITVLGTAASLFGFVEPM